MRRLDYFRACTMVSISLALATLPGWCQQGYTTTVHNDACWNTATEPSNFLTRFREIRTIEDPATHQRWMLLQNLNQPAAPALFVPTPQEFFCTGLGPKRCELTVQRASHAVIHAGDQLILSEHTRVSDAELEATALKTAAIGERLPVRLKLGGRILSAIATAQGRATLSGEGR